ncbi:MAG TPA: NrfD/PsrC family molybdoenzyme membrane anchor subunit [Chthoniobacteraceae bacterium]|nr:NrfD/PsrC family molybdoenzyme membrane anchor subunit [Chthoniobacteraceae bacterium]
MNDATSSTETKGPPPPPGTPVSPTTEAEPVFSPLGYPQRLLAPGLTYASITEEVASIPLRRIRSGWWWAAFGVAAALLFLLVVAVSWLFVTGIGIWGVNIPVAWGFAIVNFVWWIGIGHAGTLISAILLLLAQHWRNSINRTAEAMTIFAVMCAGLFPLLHLGRPQVFYFLFPYPDTMGLWPQFRSPLVWDAFAVSTYFTVSLLYWYLGLVPDFATLRDRCATRGGRFFYGVVSLGWRGSAAHWHRHQIAYRLLAGLATPLVLSVHSIVSLDFSVAILPGWHSTIFPPYFVAGAIYSGFAMVLTLLIPFRKVFALEGLITPRHLNNMALVMFISGLLVGYGYFMEVFMGLLSDDPFEHAGTLSRLWGAHSVIFYPVLLCNVIVPQLLWSRRIRMNVWALFALSIVINIGMWLERLMIVVSSLSRDFLPSSWGDYWPTFWDWATFLGTMGLFFTCFLLFLRLAPALSMSDVRELLTPGEEGPPVDEPQPEAKV